MKRGLITCLFAAALVGCSHTVSYKLSTSDRWTGPKIDKTVAVLPFKDETTPITNKVETVVSEQWHTNKTGLQSPKERTEPRTNVLRRTVKEQWRTNYRKGYRDNDLGPAVAAMLAKHLAYSGLFSNVVFGPSPKADYVLSANLAEYVARARINSTAEGIEIGSGGFGAIGALFGALTTSKMKTEVQTAVKLDNVTLATQAGEAMWHNSLETSTNFNAHFGAADSTVVFRHPDDALKRLVADLIQQLGSSSLTNQTSRTASQ